MSYIVIGNMIALIASLIMVYTGFVKNKKRIICFETINMTLFIISNLILGSISGGINNTLNCIRNILCYKDKLGLKEKIIITILAILLTLKFNNLGIIGYLPLIISITYLWLMTIKDIIKFKILIIFMMILWFIHDFYIKSYTSAMFDFGTVITNCIAIYQITKNNNLKNEV